MSDSDQISVLSRISPLFCTCRLYTSPGTPFQPGIPGGAETAAGLVRGLVFRAEARAQLSARFTTRLRGSGGPLPLVGDRIEPETDDKTRRMTPEGVFFCWRGGAERDFVNSANLRRITMCKSSPRPVQDEGSFLRDQFWGELWDERRRSVIASLSSCCSRSITPCADCMVAIISKSPSTSDQLSS